MKPLTYGLLIGAFVLFFFTIFNIYISQSYDQLFIDITSENSREAALKLLTKLDRTDEFTSQLSYFNEKFGPQIQEQLAAEAEKQKNEQQSLEDLLAKNPNDTTLLLKLASQRLREGDSKQAREYYRRAQKIDPWMKIAQLERLN